MNNQLRRSAGDYELENMHERRQRIRSERMRKWRKETRHPRAADFDGASLPPAARRFAS